jgi:serine/threonine protein kinase
MLGCFAPESILHGEYSFQSDVWQAGCILYTVLCGHSAFHPDRQYQHQITHLSYYPLNRLEWARVSADAKDLISRMLVKDPKQRISTKEILNHPWIVANIKEDFKMEDECFADFCLDMVSVPKPARSRSTSKTRDAVKVAPFVAHTELAEVRVPEPSSVGLTEASSCFL